MEAILSKLSVALRGQSSLGQAMARKPRARDVIADKEQPVPGWLSAACKRGHVSDGCGHCASLKCSHECHTRTQPMKTRQDAK